MPWKEEEGVLVKDENGNPIWINEKGEDRAVDYPAMNASLSAAKTEAVKRKDKIKELEAKFAKLEGIEDIEAFIEQAEKDREMVAGYPDKDKAVEERIKAQVAAATDPLIKKMKVLEDEKLLADSRYLEETKMGAFARSSFVNEKIHPKARALATDFLKHFSINSEGKLVATGPDGNIMYGEDGPADFDTAISRLIEAHPSKELLLMGKDSDGGGAGIGNKGKPGMDKGPKRYIDCKTSEEKRAFLANIKADE